VPLLGNDADQRFTAGKAGDATTSADRGKSEGVYAFFHTPLRLIFPGFQPNERFLEADILFFCATAHDRRGARSIYR
jgi:hypothetical protein